MGTPAQPYNPQIDREVPAKITVHLQRIYPALNDHNKAIVSLSAKVDALSKTVVTKTTTTIATSSSNSGGGGSPTNNFPGLGATNDQTGNAAYTLQQSDSGAEIQLSNAAPIAVSLNAVITSPFFCFITNLGPSTATLTPTAGTVNGVASFPLLKNSLSVIVLSGSNWFASAIPIVPLDTPAVAHQVLASYDDTTGLFTQIQLALSDITGAPLSGVSGSLGGAPMTVGQTVTIAVTIVGAAVGMVPMVSPDVYPGDGFVWDAYISAPDTVTVRLTAALAATPVASVYDVRIVQ